LTAWHVRRRAAVGIFNEALDEVTVKWETKNVDEKKDNAVRVEWMFDHSTWKDAVKDHIQQFATEQRDMPAALLNVKENKSGNNPQGKWNPAFPHSRIKSAQKEIWGVIRAEYFFLMVKADKPWDKIACKMGRTGMDSLWEHADGRIAICESKASKNQQTFVNYKGGSERGVLKALDALGVIQKNTVLQMDRQWVSLKVFEMLKAGGAQHRDRAAKRGSVQKSSLKVLQASMKGLLERWFNYYGRNEFYRLPGKYWITGARCAEFVLSQKDLDGVERHEWGFPDKVEKAEFLHLDNSPPWNELEGEYEKKRAQRQVQQSGGGATGTV